MTFTLGAAGLLGATATGGEAVAFGCLPVKKLSEAILNCEMNNWFFCQVKIKCIYLDVPQCPL